MRRAAPAAVIAIILIALASSALASNSPQSPAQRLAAQLYVGQHAAELKDHSPSVIRKVACKTTTQLYVYDCTFAGVKRDSGHSICLETWVFAAPRAQILFNGTVWACGKKPPHAVPHPPGAVTG